jgi:putative lipoic acid-binding regulatory protein
MSNQPKINYPTSWSYKIIARDETEIREAVSHLQHSETLELTFSNSSAKGTFTSMECSTKVHNEEERLGIYRQLKKNPSIKMVL